MAAIHQKKHTNNIEFTSAGTADARSHGWVAMALMLAITVAAVFSAHRLNSDVLVAEAEAEPMYSEYVYEHLSSEMSGVYYKDSQIKQVSYTK